jgi:hypothetical protein
VARSIAKRAGAINARPALRALLEHAIDYAGMFPPASLNRAAALANYCRYRDGEHAWALGRFVIPDVQLGSAPPDLDYAVLADADCNEASAIESKRVMATPKPTYCEVAIDELDAVKAAGSFAKLRTGGITPAAIPSIEIVGAYLKACAELRLPFKATAGLHHAIRAEHALTYEPNAPVATMHGFLNVFLAAAFLWHGESDIAAILAETEPAAFHFDQSAHWRGESLSANQIAEARLQFAHSFGSCSFEEPIADLEQLGWL